MTSDDDLIRLSWSRLRAYMECKQKAKISKSKYNNPASDFRNFFPGTVVDRVMRTYLENPSLDMRDLVHSHIQGSLDEMKEEGAGLVRWRDLGDRARVEVFCVELVTRLKPILKELVLPYEYEVAKSFSVPILVPYLDSTPKEIRLIGEYDLVVRTPTGINIWDLKATQDDYYYKKTFGQLVFYDLSILAQFDQTCEEIGLIQPMCKEQVKKFNISDELRSAMMVSIYGYTKSVWTGEAPPKEKISEDCNMCSRKHACVVFKATEREDGVRRIPLIDLTETFSDDTISA